MTDNSVRERFWVFARNTRAKFLPIAHKKETTKHSVKVHVPLIRAIRLKKAAGTTAPVRMCFAPAHLQFYVLPVSIVWLIGECVWISCSWCVKSTALKGHTCLPEQPLTGFANRLTTVSIRQNSAGMITKIAIQPEHLSRRILKQLFLIQIINDDMFLTSRCRQQSQYFIYKTAYTIC